MTVAFFHDTHSRVETQKETEGDMARLATALKELRAEDPEVLIYVVINEPNLEKQSQSVMATTLAKDILTEIFPYLNIYPDEPIPEDETADEPTEEDIEIPTE